MPAVPRAIRLRTYQVGFGDCLLLSFRYGPLDERHVLIDFGTSCLPDAYESDHMVRVARDIRTATGGKLTAVVASHRHQDHVSGFATRPNGRGAGDIIRGLHPDLVIQPWTEDPDAPEGADGPASPIAGSPLAASLDHMHAIAEHALRESRRPPADLGLQLAHCQELACLGHDNIKNPSAVANLAAMGRAGQAEYLYYGARTALADLLPGVNVRVLGPPTLRQSSGIRRQRSSDEREFWQLQAAACDGRTAGLKAPPLFPDAVLGHPDPPSTRWFVRRLQQVRGQQLLSIVRTLDRAMNNTSLILLFTVGRRRLLFPGDAQVESWSYALDEADDAEDNRAELAKVDLYKVGHHGSRNATPKTLWGLLCGDDEQRGAASRRPLRSICSTMEGRHGSPAADTEVPRATLVQALDERTDYFSTQSLTETASLHHDLTWDVAERDERRPERRRPRTTGGPAARDRRRRV